MKHYGIMDARAQGAAHDNSLSLQRFYLLLEELGEHSGDAIAPERFQEA